MFVLIDFKIKYFVILFFKLLNMKTFRFKKKLLKGCILSISLLIFISFDNVVEKRSLKNKL